MAAATAPGEVRAVRAKEAAERRRLTEVLREQLRRDMLRLLNEEIHTDLTLHVGHASFKVHKAVLQARSPRFFAHVTTYNATEDTVAVPHVEPSEIQGFLQCVYGSLWNVKDREDHILQMMADHSVSNHEEFGNSQSSVHTGDGNADNFNGSPDLNVQLEENLNGNDDYNSEPPSELGKDLLSIFKQSCCTDIIIQTEDTCFHAHRAILCARSSYFAAMLSGCWVETSQDLIQIQNVKPADMEVILNFIYGGVGDLPKSAEPGQILSIADMYGMEGLKEVAIFVLKRDYCKFFIKPMVGMQQSVLECLSIAHSVGEEPLYTSCMKWMEKYFVKCWSERSFASLPAELQRSCLSALVQSISYRNAALLFMESDRLISSLPEVKWTERVRNLASELQEECVSYMVLNFSQTIRSESFAHLLQAQGMSSRPYLLEHIFNEIEKNVSFENCSSLFIAVDELLNLAMESEMVFTCKIQALRDKLWSFLVQSFYAVRHTEGWKLMRPSDQDKIQAAAFDKGDDRRLAKKPTFTSSQQNRPKTVTSKDANPSEKKRYSDSYLLDRRKMKSDSLGASGHTTHLTRTSMGKGKEDDAKGKDAKKVATKLSKDPKPLEKTTVARPRIIVKSKVENNGHATTDSSASRSDSASNPKLVSSVRTGTRPKATNGSVTQPAKVKLIKKTGKDAASPVKVTTPKSTNCNGELSNSSPSPGEKTSNGTIDEQHSASSQPLHKTLKNNLESSKDSAAGTKLKSSTKMSNGLSVIKKEAECREPNGTAKIPVDGKDESGLLKKKGIKVSNVSQQRPKSAPASLTKKQGVSGDHSDLHKSVSSKQTNVKADTKLVNNSASVDKHVSINKKAAKTSLAPANKAQSTMPSSKPSLGVHKPVMNHKESKNKVPNLAKAPSLMHKSSQKSSPSKVKKCQTLPTNGTEAPVSQEEEAKLSTSCDVEGETDQAKQCLQNQLLTAHGQEASMGNQDCERQAPNSEQFLCQENLTDASVLHSKSNSNTALTEAANESKMANANSGTGDVHIINVLGERKLECKNICDSENSKFADSSSESELCSVKEVERIPKVKEEMTSSQLSSNTSMQKTSPAESCYLASGNYPLALNNGGNYMSCSSERRLSDYQTDKHIVEAVDHENFEFMGQWNKHSGMLLERESPESESGTASTSSDDIKPRSEDYDAGGSQDDDGSNERGISKCSTMRCHDFLGRSSSDTSTPEELKGYDGSLRIDVKMKRDSTELFRVNSTSDDEGPRKRIEPWLQRDASRLHPSHTAVCSTAQFSQEIEHLSSSADETEDERSETESTGVKIPEDVVGSEPFQGIVNLAFDDNAEIERDAQQTAGNGFVRTVLLSVDECEELGSDDGESHPSQMQHPPSLTPNEVFVKSSDDSQFPGCNHGLRLTEDEKEYSSRRQPVANDGSVADKDIEEACKGHYQSTEAEFKSQTRPCHLDLYTESPSETQKFGNTKTGNACKNPLLGYQGRDNHAPSTDNSNTALSAGHIDDNDSLAQSRMYDHRPSKSLSPIYEMDPVEGIEQRLKTEPRIMDIEIEDQQFVERDWTLLRQLLADHGSDVDIINSVPEDLSLAQYLINQTLLLAKENSKSQGKAWGDLSSPFEDSTSVTVTSFSPDECSSPHGEWTILELETHH